eukprot:TRINITY_DN22579_c0_g1_i1.p1 TRINITY_DN22579_c0_g1~~TRINITY_DN22579_c0_g1_i1.p1  ORF type:complete len:470 (+),score=133.29 TRINITY_DN22579_c0_g1_i1:61-1470(+)
MGRGEDAPATAARHEGPKQFTLVRAVALNTLNMFGTGPFVSLPLLLAAAVPPGPQALLGYVAAFVACTCDSLIWAELGTMYPSSGGSYVYLKQCFGEATYGRAMSFLFVWQQVFSGPMEIASGYAAISKYLTYVVDLDSTAESVVASALALLTLWLLYRDGESVGAITVALWVGTLAAIGMTLYVGVTNAVPGRLHQEVTVTPTFLLSMGAAMKFSVYDLMGYYDVCYIADQVERPHKTIPIACIFTCIAVGFIFIAVDCSVIAAMAPEAFADPASSVYIMSVFAEQHMGGRAVAVAFTALVAYTIFGSSFSLMVGYAQIPYVAAKDGTFFKQLAHVHPKIPDLPDYSLLLTGGMTVAFCWLSLDTLINGLIATRLIIQFVAQAIGLMLHRARHPGRSVYRMPLYPLPCLVQIALFLFVFASTESYTFQRATPVLEAALAVMVSGIAAFLALACVNRTWPYAPPQHKLA